MWYSVYRTEKYQEIWREMKQLEVNNIFLLEVLQAQLALCHGKYIHIIANHYIRLRNPITSSSRMAQPVGVEADMWKVFFDVDYRRQILNMSEYVAKQVGIDIDIFLGQFKNYYLPKSTKISCKLFSKPQFLLRKIIPNSLKPTLRMIRYLQFVPIEVWILWINFSNKAARLRSLSRMS
jgi:hypothetical protein